MFEDEGDNAGYVKNGKINEVIEYMELKMSQNYIYKLISELDSESTGYIEVSGFKNAILKLEIERILGQDETELLDAYVAMGGDTDGGGCVDAQHL